MSEVNSQLNFDVDGDIIGDDDVLTDKCGRKEKPWKFKKTVSRKLSSSFMRIAQKQFCSYERNRYFNKAYNVLHCSDFLEFIREVETQKLRLKHGNFCRDRLCPMCAWRRTLKIFSQVSKVMDVVQVEEPDLVPLFLTLTVRNCIGKELINSLNVVFAGLKMLFKQRKIQRIAKGWFRALEVTYNAKKDTYHPHIHAIVFVDRLYFRRKNKDYMKTADWVQMWRMSAKLDYNPICHIKTITRNFQDITHKQISDIRAVLEVTKYTIKDTDYLTSDENLTDKLVEITSEALKGRRLHAFGGLLYKIARRLKAEDVGEGDLVHIDDDTVREDVATAIEVYKWVIGLNNYYRVE